MIIFRASLRFIDAFILIFSMPFRRFDFFSIFALLLLLISSFADAADAYATRCHALLPPC